MLDGRNLGSEGQLHWLKHGLLTSTARWKIIFTSVVTNPTTKFPEGWGAYQTEWNSLRDFINNTNIQGVVFISGDVHAEGIDNGLHAGDDRAPPHDNPSAKLLIPIPKTQSTFHPPAQRNTFRRRDMRQRSKGSAGWNQSLRRSPNSNRLLLRLSAMIA
jgi:hypothetical protein